jgi:hypothetical protein
MATGISEAIMDWTDIVEAIDADAPTKKRGPYKKSRSILSECNLWEKIGEPNSGLERNGLAKHCDPWCSGQFINFKQEISLKP